MTENKVRRLIAISEASVSETLDQLPIVGRAIVRLFLDRQAIKDKGIMEACIKRSDVDWTIVRPPFLTDGPEKRKYRAGEAVNLKIYSTISRADLADYIVKQAKTVQSVRKAVVIYY